MISWLCWFVSSLYHNPNKKTTRTVFFFVVVACLLVQHKLKVYTNIAHVVHKSKTVSFLKHHSNQHFAHPHAGAKDKFGHWGYVHNAAVLRQIPLSFIVLAEEKHEVCAQVGQATDEKDNSKLISQVFNQVIKVSKTAVSALASSIKVFCAVYSYPGNRNQTNAIAMTWARRCDGYMTASTETIDNLAVVNLPHFGTGVGKYSGIWQKVRSMVSYFYDNFLNNYDFLFICGDDTYLIMENLKEFLTSPSFVKYAGGYNYTNIVYTGDFVHPSWKERQYGKSFYFMGGGSGYVLNRVAVRALVERVFPVCKTDTNTSQEDLLMGYCLQKVLNVTGYDSRDEQGRDRFFGVSLVVRTLFDPQKGNVPKYLLQQFPWRRNNLGWTNPLLGTNAISPKAISFHLAKPPAKMKRLERLFYRMSPALVKQDCNS